LISRRDGPTSARCEVTSIATLYGYIVLAPLKKCFRHPARRNDDDFATRRGGNRVDSER